MKRIILASASPRRQELLRLAGVDFEVMASQAEELVPEGTPADQVSELLARKKAEAVADIFPEAVVIGADTTVELDGLILGKPKDKEDACRMLRLLSGSTHRVFTGVALSADGCTESFTSVTEVTFYPLSEQEIRDYASTGEPLDKAGAYGIQGKGCALVKEIRGDYYTVVGLPVAETLRRLRVFSEIHA